jgi:hypothetical protein
MKTASQLINELKALQEKYGEDFLIRVTAADYYSHYGKDVEEDFSTFFNGDFLTLTYKLKAEKDFVTDEIMQPKITFRKSKY